MENKQKKGGKKDSQLCPCYVVYFVLDIKNTIWHWQHF